VTNPPTRNPAGSPKVYAIKGGTAREAGNPEELSRFESRPRKLVQVPKSELDEKRKPS
jgi:hypothetical protein